MRQIAAVLIDATSESCRIASPQLSIVHSPGAQSPSWQQHLENGATRFSCRVGFRESRRGVHGDLLFPGTSVSRLLYYLYVRLIFFLLRLHIEVLHERSFVFSSKYKLLLLVNYLWKENNKWSFASKTAVTELQMANLFKYGSFSTRN